MRPPLFVVGTDPLLGRLRHHARLAVGGAAIGLLAGTGVYLLSPVTHTATAAVELTSLRDQLDLNPTGERANLVSLDTDAQLARSDAVVLAVAAEQQRSVEAVRDSLTVTARPQSRVLLLHYRAATTDTARQGAHIAAQRYLEERDRLYVQPQREFVDDVGRTTEAIDPQFDLVASAGSVPGRETLRRRAFVQELGLSGAGRVIEQARLTSVADRGDIEVPLTSGAATGALAAICLGLLVDWRRRDRSASARSPAVKRPHGRRIRPPRRSRVIAGTAVMLALGTALGAVATMPLLQPDYVGISRVHVPPMLGNAFAFRGSVNQERLDFETEAGLARSDEVLGRVVTDLGTAMTIDAVRARTTAEPAGRAEVLQIRFRADDRELAERGARLIAEHTVAIRQARAVAASAARQQQIDQGIAAAEADLDAALGPAGDPDMVNALNRRLTLLRSDARTLVNNRTEPGSVIATRVVRDPVDTYLAAGVLASGALLGIAVGVLTRGGTRLLPSSGGRRSGGRRRGPVRHLVAVAPGTAL